MSTDYPADPDYERSGESQGRIGLSLLDAFRDQWSRGDRISAEEFVRQHQNVGSDEEVLLDVVFAEYVAREELGERPTLEEYVRRFPNLGERLTRLLSLDEAIRGLPAVDPGAETHDPHAAETMAAPRRPTEIPDETTTRIGKYLVVGELGSGGQGKVYRAVHPSLAREVVVKISHLREGVPAEFRDELIREGRLLAELDHPHLARVHDFDFHEGEPFLVMEYVPGANLEQYARQAKLPAERIASLTAKIARALAAVHRKGVVHRDLKPRNIMIDTAGEPRLIDFGLALADSPWSPDSLNEHVVGTLAFMAPEQAVVGTERVGPAADLFALGGVLYFLLTGKPPFKGRDFNEAVAKVAVNDHDRAALDKANAPESLKAICRRLMATMPGDRYASADDAAKALERVATPARRPMWLPIAAAAGLLLVVGSVVTWLAMRTPAGIEKPVIAVRPPEVSIDLLNPKTHVFREIADAVRDGDVYKVRIKAAAGVHVSLFRVGGDTKLEHEIDIAPQEHGMTIDYPSATGKGIRAAGPAGTEMYLAIARRKGPVTAAELEGLFAGPAWPKLAAGSLLRLKTDEVKVVQGNRGAEIIDIGPDPEEIVKARLEALRLGLLNMGFDGFEGFVYAHVE
jgi:eukaryotic-like serine/threonine-protein kinase